MSPYRYQCNLSGKLLSLRSFFMVVILAVVCYYGWPIIQTMIVLSPIPDPSDVKNRASGMLRSLRGKLGGAGEAARPSNESYQSNFDKAPDMHGDGSDDDEEDIGRDFSQKKDLNYDSDEKDEYGHSDQTELVSLDTRKNEPAKKHVPKLKKPGT